MLRKVIGLIIIFFKLGDGGYSVLSFTRLDIFLSIVIHPQILSNFYEMFLPQVSNKQ